MAIVKPKTTVPVAKPTTPLTQRPATLLQKNINPNVKPGAPRQSGVTSVTGGWVDPVAVGGKLMERSDAIKQGLWNDTTTSAPATTPTTAPATTAPATPSYTQQLQDFKLPDAPQSPTYATAPDYATQLQRATEQYQNMYNPLKSQAIDNINERANQMGLLQRGTTQPLFAQYKVVTDLNNEQTAKAMDLANQLYQQGVDNNYRDNTFKYQQYSDADAKNFRNAQFDYGKLQDLLGQQNTDRQFDYTKGIDDRNYNYQVGRDTVADNQWNKQYDYNKGVDDRNYNYQVGRDKVGDSQWQSTFNQNKTQQGIDNSYRDKVYNRGVYESDRAYNKAKSSGGSSGGRRSSGGSYSSSGGGGRGGTPTTNEAKFKNELHNQQARYKYFRSKEDIRYEFKKPEVKKKIVAKIGEEGYQAIMADIDSLKDNFMGSVWKDKHITGRK